MTNHLDHAALLAAVQIPPRQAEATLLAEARWLALHDRLAAEVAS